MRNLDDPVTCRQCGDLMREIADTTWRCASCGFASVEPLRPTLPIVLTELVFTPASAPDQRQGLLAFVAATLNGSLRLDGLALRRTAAGRLAVSWPRRASGVFVVRPLDDRTRRELERQVIVAWEREVVG